MIGAKLAIANKYRRRHCGKNRKPNPHLRSVSSNDAVPSAPNYRENNTRENPTSLQSEGKDYPPISCLINGHNSIIAVTQPMKTTRIPIYLTPPIKFVQFLFFRQKASCTLFAYLPSLKKQKTQNKRPLSLSLSLSHTHTHTH